MYVRSTVGFLLFILFAPLISDAQIVRTECNGVWSKQEVWGGSLPSAGDTIIVRHKVKNIDPIDLNKNHVRIVERGALCGYHPLEIPTGSSLHNYGFLGLSSMDLKDSLINYGKLVADSFITVTGYFYNAGGSTTVGTYSCFDKPTCTPAILRISSDSIASNTVGPHYEWTLNGTPLPDSSKQVPLQGSGTYRVRIIDKNGDSTSYSPPYEHGMASMDDEEKQEKAVSVRPNPNDGEFVIEGDGPEAHRRIKIYGPRGRVLMERPFGTRQIRVELPGASEGIYFLRVIGNNDNSILRKFVVE